MAQPPSDYDSAQILIRFREGSEALRQVIFYACIKADFFPQLFQEAWSVDSDFREKAGEGPAKFGNRAVSC